MKTCSKCGKEKPIEEFPTRYGKPNSWCLVCKRAYDREQYHISEVRKEQLKVSRKLAINRAKNFIYAYLVDHPCVDCGFSDIRALQFDHVDGKNFNISSGMFSGFSVGMLKNEVGLCKVRCANCHMIKHSNRASVV